jgi:hypothetical protein
MAATIQTPLRCFTTELFDWSLDGMSAEFYQMRS